MTDSPALIELRKSLADAADAPAPEASREVAQAALHKILAAIEKGVCPLGDWERRCLAAAITSLRGGKTNEARTRARQALWPDENRRSAAVAKFPPRPGMITIDELKREFAAALAMPRRGSAPAGAGRGRTAKSEA